jgi:hypothetical protein
MLDVAGGILIVLALLCAVVIGVAKFDRASITANKAIAKEDRLKGGAILLGVVGFVVWLLFVR